MPGGENRLVSPLQLLAEKRGEGLVVDEEAQRSALPLLVGQLRVPETGPGRLTVRHSQQLLA